MWANLRKPEHSRISIVTHRDFVPPTIMYRAERLPCRYRASSIRYSCRLFYAMVPGTTERSPRYGFYHPGMQRIVRVQHPRASLRCIARRAIRSLPRCRIFTLECISRRNISWCDSISRKNERGYSVRVTKVFGDAFLGRETLLLIGMTTTGVNDAQIQFRETHRLHPPSLLSHMRNKISSGL